MNIDISEGRLEPEVIGRNLPVDNVCILSAAISLKRIADAQEKYLPEIVRTLNTIASRRTW